MKDQKVKFRERFQDFFTAEETDYLFNLTAQEEFGYSYLVKVLNGTSLEDN